MSAANSPRNRKPASETKPVIALAAKRTMTAKLLRRMEAGDKLPLDEEFWLLAWSTSATPAIKARLDKVLEAPNVTCRRSKGWYW